MKSTVTRSGLWNVLVEIEGLGPFDLRTPTLKESVELQEVLEKGDRALWAATVLATIIVSAPQLPGFPEPSLPPPAPNGERVQQILAWPYAVTEPLLLATEGLDCPWSAFLRGQRDGSGTVGKGAGDTTSSPPSQSGS